MLLAIVLVSLGNQLLQGDISIELTDRTATVEAHYRLAAAQSVFEATLIVIPSQSLERLDALQTLASQVLWEQRGGRIRIQVPGGLDRSQDVALRYRVRGRLERIPLPVPNQPAEPGLGSVSLSVRGLDPSARFLDGFPRLVQLEGDVAQARLDNVPSLLHIPPAATTWSVSRLAQLIAILFIVGSSAAWAIRAQRSRPEPG